MKIFETLHTIEAIDQLIRLKATGSRRELALRLRKSERTVHNLLEIMKAMDAPIYYCKERRSYCYLEEVKFQFGFIVKNQQKFWGGTNFLQPGKISALSVPKLLLSTLIGGTENPVIE